MKRTFRLLGVLLCSLWLMAVTSWAGTSGGAEPVEVEVDGNTDIYAGVVVDYMGKLKFHVLDRDTGEPIPGASVEIKIKVGSEERYVLFGVTNEEGYLEIDVAYAKGKLPEVEEVDGTLTFTGSLLFLDSNQIEYRVYKAGWLPYPQEGTVILESKEVPQIVTVYLYKKTGGGNGGNGGGGGGSHSTGTTGSTPGNNPDGLPEGGGIPPELAIPKTGIGGYAEYWAAGAVLFLIGACLLAYLIYKERDKRKESIR